MTFLASLERELLRSSLLFKRWDQTAAKALAHPNDIRRSLFPKILILSPFLSSVDDLLHGSVCAALDWRQVKVFADVTLMLPHILLVRTCFVRFIQFSGPQLT